jgi:tetratricopeptide (TPR) repeat protein
VTKVIKPPRGWVSLKLGDVWAYRELLYFLVYQRDLLDSMLPFNQPAIPLGTTNPAAYYALAEADAATAAWPAAIANQRRGLQLDSEASPARYVLLGNWQRAAGDKTGALAAYHQALQMAPGSLDALAAIRQIESQR